MAEPLRVLLVASEAVPFAKTGGLGDMVPALARALRRRGVDARILMPRYGWIRRDALLLHERPFGVPIGPAQLWCAILEGRVGDVPVYFVEHDVLYDRPHVYGPPGGAYGDNCLRFALLSRAAVALPAYLDWWPHLFHAHDWQAALVPVYLNAVAGDTPAAAAASLLTIHNLAYQGQFPAALAPETGLTAEQLHHLGLGAGDGFNLLKGGILHATLLTTVSPSYAREIQTMAFGEGLDGVLRARRDDLFGVLNGIDTEAWDPARDPHLPHHFTAEDRTGKRFCKADLQAEAGLPAAPDAPLIGVVTRLAHQKGVDLIAAAADRILDRGAQMVLLGTGDRWAEQFFGELSARRPRAFHAWIAFDERLAHLIEAGADLFLMPSRWEPCGMNQMYSQRYGTLPIVRATGGLNDTVENLDPATGRGTGFKFHDPTPEALLGTVAWALHVWRNEPATIDRMIREAMARDHGWGPAAARYDYLYRLALVRRRGD